MSGVVSLIKKDKTSPSNAHLLVCWCNSLSSCITLSNMHPMSSVMPSTLQSMWPTKSSSKSFSTDAKHSFVEQKSSELSWQSDFSRPIHNSNKRNAWYLNMAETHSCLMAGSSCNRKQAELHSSLDLCSSADWWLAPWQVLNAKVYRSTTSSFCADVKARVWLSAWERMPWSKHRCENDSAEPVHQIIKSAQQTYTKRQ